MSRSNHTNQSLFSELSTLLPGGVNSPVRAFNAVGGTPVVMDHADGAHLWDVEGNEYIDFVGSWGPLILGHNHPAVRHAVESAVSRGLSFGTPCAHELELARLVVEAVPGIERVRFVNSGTEATMTAIRLARAFTGRDAVVKLAGGYHGHADAFLVQAGSGAATFGTPDSPGVPAATVAHTLVAPFNDLEAIRALFSERGDEIACFILEPIPGNMGMVPPEEGFLRELAGIVHEAGALLIFDEVISGFRVAHGGAQARYDVVPDITTLGKIIGGGMPVGAFGAREEIMSLLSPSGPVYQSGTLSGNPVTMAAGAAALKEVKTPGFYEGLEGKAQKFFDKLAELAEAAPVDATVNSIAGMGTLFFTSGPVRDYAGAKRSDTKRFGRFFHGMLKRGIYLPPAQFECMFISAAHTQDDLEAALQAAEATLAEME